MGRMEVRPGEVAVVQAGIRFSVGTPDGPSRGYVCEVFGGHFQLPDLGPIGKLPFGKLAVCNSVQRLSVMDAFHTCEKTTAQTWKSEAFVKSSTEAPPIWCCAKGAVLQWTSVT